MTLANAILEFSHVKFVITPIIADETLLRLVACFVVFLVLKLTPEESFFGKAPPDLTNCFELVLQSLKSCFAVDFRFSPTKNWSNFINYLLCINLIIFSIK